jgi:hypothetical protein
MRPGSEFFHYITILIVMTYSIFHFTFIGEMNKSSSSDTPLRRYYPTSELLLLSFNWGGVDPCSRNCSVM